MTARPRRFITYFAVIAAVLTVSMRGTAQSTASIEGKISDQNGAVVPGVEIKLVNVGIAVERNGVTDDDGRYQMTSLQVGGGRLEVKALGFQTQVIESLRVEVGRKVIEDFHLQVGQASEQVTITSANGLLDNATVSVGHMIDRRTVQDIPLNGRHFLDLGLLVP